MRVAAVALIVSLGVLCQASLVAQPQLLLVVGAVSDSYARVLYQPLSGAPDSVISYTVYPDGAKVASAQGEIDLAHARIAPRILLIGGLSGGVFYRVEFGSYGNVTFTTPTPSQKHVNLAVVSCNRYFEDHDGSMWSELATNAPIDRDATLHLGDQVYMDWLVRDLKASTETYTDLQLQEMFRNVYRVSWGNADVQPTLRHGAHYMIPDDHEFVDNFDAHIYTGQYAAIMKAARRVYYEYQFQLSEDAFDPATGEELPPVKEDRVYRFMRIGNTAILLLDFRIQRAIVGSAESPLLGPKQFGEFITALSAYAADPTIDHVIVATSVPALYTNELSARIVHTVEKERMPMHPDMQPEVLRILDLLAQYDDKVLLLGGDIHMYLDTILINQNGKHIRQISTSGMTSGSNVGRKIKLYLFHLFAIRLTTKTVQHWSFDHIQAFLYQNYLAIDVNGEAINCTPHLISTGMFENFAQFIFDWPLEIVASIASFILGWNFFFGGRRSN